MGNLMRGERMWSQGIRSTRQALPVRMGRHGKQLRGGAGESYYTHGLGANFSIPFTDSSQAICF